MDPTDLDAVDEAIYILRNNTIDPTDNGCTFNGRSCFDPDAPAATPTFELTAQEGESPVAWTKITLATQRKLRRNLVTPTAVVAPADVAALDDTTEVCWDLQNLFLPPVGTDCEDAELRRALIFTSLSIDLGGARRIIREVGSNRKLPGVPAGLTLNGCGAGLNFSGGNSANWGISGIDTGAEAVDEAAIGTVCDSDNPLVDAATPHSENLTGAPPSDIQNVDGGLDPLHQDCAGLELLVNIIRGSAAQIYTGDTTSLTEPGTVSDPVINFVDGDLDISGNFNGAGILLVTGDVDFSATPTYNGVIYVIGTGVFEAPGTGTFNGGVFLANTIPTCSDDPPTLGSPSFTIQGGGNASGGIYYDTDLTEPPGGYMPIRILSLNY